MPEDPRAILSEATTLIRAHFGARLMGLYLFGSLAAGDFYPGRSDLDLIAVLASDMSESGDLPALRRLHERFEGQHPQLRDRIEVLYVSRQVLATFIDTPTGIVARISPGEPLHQRDLGGDLGWLLDWHAVVSEGETLLGRPPLTLGPPVSPDRFKAAVASHLSGWRKLVRHNDAAHLPAPQGYVIAAVCRGLFALATGRQVSKEKAVAWFAENHPEDAEYVRRAYRAYRQDVHEPSGQLVDWVDRAVARGPHDDAGLHPALRHSEWRHGD